MSDMKKLESILNDLTRRAWEFHNGDFVCLGYHYEGQWWVRTSYAFPTAHKAANLFEALELLEQEIRDREEFNRMEAAQ